MLSSYYLIPYNWAIAKHFIHAKTLKDDKEHWSYRMLAAPTNVIQGYHPQELSKDVQW